MNPEKEKILFFTNDIKKCDVKSELHLFSLRV